MTEDLGRGKRVKQPTRRLTYVAPGRQSETELPTYIPQTMEESGVAGQGTKSGQWTIPDVKLRIARIETVINSAEETIAEVKTLVEKYDGIDENAIPPEEVESWKKARTQYTAAKTTLTRYMSELATFQEKLQRLERNESQASSSAVVPPKSTQGRPASPSLTTSTIRDLELDSESKALAARHAIEEEVEELQSTIEILQLKASQEPDQAEAFLKEAKLLELKIKQRERKIEKIERRIHEMLELQKRIVGNDIQVDQDLANLDAPLNSHETVSRWAPNASASPFAREQSPSIPPVPPLCPENQDVLQQVLLAQLQLLRRPAPEKDWAPRDLPLFGGKAEDWPIFRNEFYATTPKDKVNSTENAIRLRKALKGSAREAVAGMLAEPANVSKIMDTLELSFGRKELVIGALIKKAEQVKAPDNSKPESFIVYGRAIQQLVSTATSMKEERYLNDVGLMTKLVEKLPLSYGREWLTWIQARPDLTQNLSSFGKWIDAQMSIMIRLAKPVVFDDAPKAGADRVRRGPAVMAAVHEEKEGCPKCERLSHGLAQCFTFKKMKLPDRVAFVEEKGLCFKCFSSNHILRNCPSDKKCGIDGCTGNHNSLIHGEPPARKWGRKRWNPRGQPRATPEEQVGEDKNAAVPEQEQRPAADVRHRTAVTRVDIKALNSMAAAIRQSKPVSVVRVRLRGPTGKVVKAYAGLDSQSTGTFLEKALAEELQLGGSDVESTCIGMGGNAIVEVAKLVDLEISGCYHGSEYFEIKEAVTMNSLGLPLYSQNADFVKQEWSHLRKARLENFDAAKIQLIIGEDHPYLTAHRNILERGQHEPMAKRTVLGWVLAGRRLTKQTFNSMCAAVQPTNEQLENLLKEAFSIDSFGIFQQQSKGSREDQRALEMLEQHSQKLDNVWECPLLWKSEDVKLPDSKPEAVRRLLSNERRMAKDPAYKEMYIKKIEEYEQKGFVSVLTPEEAKVRTNHTYYLPHFGHLNPNKPGKLRLVFDAAAKVKGVSLNDNLLTGPDLIRPLPAVLWNFRRHNEVIQGDTEEMFHRVAVREADRDAQRFLFRKDPPDGPILEYQMNVLIFGATCSPATAIYIKNRNADEFMDDYPEAVRATKEDMFVDDCLSGGQTAKETVVLQRQIRAINASGNFHVKRWCSNSKEVTESIPVDDRSSSAKDFGGKEAYHVERVLGLWWSPQDDTFTFRLNFAKVKPEILDGKRPTKRELCSLLMSVFDPLGFLSNLKVKGMILLQKSWRAGIEWDDAVTEEIHIEWLNFLNYLKKTPEIKIPRCYCYDIHLATFVELHTFVDAGSEACSCICYLRVSVADQVTVSFVSSRVKVAPLKKLAIPRLELVAATMGAGLADTIRKELRVDVTKRVFWSDSRVVLLWIRSESLRLQEFVGNRVSKVQELTSVSEWRWIPTEENVADDGTRLHTEIEISSDSRWLKGPAFLLRGQETWPSEEPGVIDADEDLEFRKNVVCALGDPFGIGASNDEACGLSGDKGTIKVERFSCYTRMIRAQAGFERVVEFWLAKWRKTPPAVAPWSLRFGHRIPGKKKGESFAAYQSRVAPFLREGLRSMIDASDLKKAEMSLIRRAQMESFPMEYKALRLGKKIVAGELKKLSPCLVNGVIRMKGRIVAAAVPDELKMPIIPPNKRHLTQLLVMREHIRCGHQGKGTILSNLRQEYWIISGGVAVNRSFTECLKCRHDRARPMIPEMGALPNYRLTVGKPPFYHTGVDLFGPIEVTVQRHHEKRWGILFTCMVTRAVFLDKVSALTKEETLMAITRFISERGRPAHIFSVEKNGVKSIGSR